MANESAKRAAATNTSILRFLRLGFLVSNAVHIFYLFLWRDTVTKRAVIGYAVTEAIALAFWLSLAATSTPRYEAGKLVRAGEDLSKPGLTQYMLDVIYITLATHMLTALVWRRFWWIYALIPGFAIYAAVTHLVMPRLRFTNTSLGQESAQPGLSKRQKKLQERYGTGQKVKYGRP